MLFGIFRGSGSWFLDQWLETETGIKLLKWLLSFDQALKHSWKMFFGHAQT